MATTSVDGLISGLNTTQLVEQLVQAEAGPQASLRQKVNANQSVVGAYQSLNAKLAALQSAAAALTTLGSFDAVKANSSQTNAATATATTGALPGTLAFDVKKLASAHAVVSHATVSTVGATVATGNELRILDVNRTTTRATVALTDRSLAGVVTAINASKDAGLTAAAVQTSPGVYRLQLTSRTTGEASQFVVDGLDVGGSTVFDSVKTGSEAQLLLGENYTVSSPTNTFTGLLPGVTVTALKTTTEATATKPNPASEVTLTVQRDGDGVADKVAALVKAANAALDEIEKNASYDPATKRAGVFLADGLVRALRGRVLDAVSLGGPALPNGLSHGVSLTRDGHLNFDRSKFLDAFKQDPQALQRSLASSGAFSASGLSGTISLADSTARTPEAKYDVLVTRAATQATATVASGGAISAGAITMTVNGTSSGPLALTDGMTWQTVADGLNRLAAEKGLGASATVESGQLVVRTTAYGSGAKLSVDVSAAPGLSAAVTAGQDVAGTIAGIAATGSGRTLRAPADSKVAPGLALDVTLTADDLAGGSVSGTLDYRRGIAQRLESLGWEMTDSIDGALTKAIKSRQDNVKDLNDRIEAWDRRLELRRRTLQRQFGALEVALGKLKDQSNWLAGQLGSLSKSNG